MSFAARTSVELSPAPTALGLQCAGLCLFQGPKHHFLLVVQDGTVVNDPLSRHCLTLCGQCTSHRYLYFV